jgi:hypothetical protein
MTSNSKRLQMKTIGLWLLTLIAVWGVHHEIMKFFHYDIWEFLAAGFVTVLISNWYDRQKQPQEVYS